MYRIEYHGKLLDGFNPEIVRMDVAVRLHLRDTQLERLFSGERVVLKRAVSEQAANHYLRELRGMGLDAQLVPIGEVAQAAALTYAVVFWGHVLPALDRAAVMAAAARRFRVTPALVMQIFSGSKVVLKRGVDAATGARWVTDLAVIGMQVELELEVSALPASQPAIEQAATPAEEEHPFGGLLRTACDLSGTPFSGYGEGIAEAPPSRAFTRHSAAAHATNRFQQYWLCACGTVRFRELPRLRPLSTASGTVREMWRSLAGTAQYHGG
jgi:hypothetical protein